MFAPNNVPPLLNCSPNFGNTFKLNNATFLNDCSASTVASIVLTPLPATATVSIRLNFFVVWYAAACPPAIAVIPCSLWLPVVTATPLM